MLFPIKTSPEEVIFEEIDSGLLVIICKCSGARIFASFIISELVLHIPINPLFFRLDWTIFSL